MLTDLHFYYAAIPAVLLVGLTKGGMGEALALLGVPILSMVMPPVQAAAILLPILIVMDMVALWAWRHESDSKTLLYMLPGGLFGILIGYTTSAIVPGYVMRILIGTVAIAFAARYFFNLWRARHGYVPPTTRPQYPQSRALGISCRLWQLHCPFRWRAIPGL